MHNSIIDLNVLKIIKALFLPLHDPSWKSVPNGQKQSKLPGLLTHLILGSEQDPSTRHSSISMKNRQKI